MSIIGSKVVNKRSREEGTIIRVNNNEIVVSFGYGGIENKIPLDKISEYFYVSTEFMNDLYDYIHGYEKKTKVPVMSFIEFSKKYPMPLNEQQKEAVKAVEGPNLILAVPGSGKTTVLTYRLGYMTIARRIKPENILCITYTKAATNEMKERLHKFFGDDIKGEIHISTINSFSNEIVSQRTNYKTADEEVVNKIISSLLKKHHIPFYDDIVRIYVGSISLVKSKPKEMWEETIDKVIQERNVSKSFKEIFLEYNNGLKEKQLIDFNDQNILAYEHLRDNNILRSLYRNKYRYICVDEAQDTNEVQNRIIKLLAGNEANVFMVGDDDQSIYSFNGSCPEELYNFDKTYPGAKVFKIETNYRSTKRIVSFSNSFINKSRNNRIRKSIESVREEGNDIKDIRVPDMIHQALYVVDQLIDNDKDTAILYRENSTGIVMAYHLKKSNIPFCFAKDDISMFKTGSFRKVINYLKLLNDPRDIVAFELIYYDLDEDISPEGCYKMRHNILKNEGTDVFKELKDYANDYIYSYYLRSKINEIENYMYSINTKTIDEIISDACEYMLEGNEFQIKKTRNILLSVSEIDDSLRSYIERLKGIEDMINDKNKEKDKQGVVLSTIHGSKGLEYSKVFVVDLYDGVFPTKASEKDAELLEEEKRVFYVAITRAKDELYILNMHDNHSSLFEDLSFRSNNN